MQPPTTIHNHLQPSTTIQKNTHNHPKITQKSQNLSQTVMLCILDVNPETDVDFDSDMKQWHIYMCVCLCAYILYKSLYVLFFG